MYCAIHKGKSHKSLCANCSAPVCKKCGYRAVETGARVFCSPYCRAGFGLKKRGRAFLSRFNLPAFLTDAGAKSKNLLEKTIPLLKRRPDKYKLSFYLFIYAYIILEKVRAKRAEGIIPAPAKRLLSAAGVIPSKSFSYMTFLARKTLSGATRFLFTVAVLLISSLVISASYLRYSAKLLLTGAHLIRIKSGNLAAYVYVKAAAALKTGLTFTSKTLLKSLKNIPSLPGELKKIARAIPLKEAFILSAVAVLLLNFHMEMNGHYGDLGHDALRQLIAPPRPDVEKEITAPLSTVISNNETIKTADSPIIAAPYVTPLNAKPLITVSLKTEEKPRSEGHDALRRQYRPRPDQAEKPLSIIPAPPDMTRGSDERMDLSITFDGGSESNGTELILDTLRERGIKTTIFLTGEFIKKYPGLVRQMLEDGHEIGNHSMHHPHLTEFAASYKQKTLPNVTKEFVARELRETAELFTKVTGEKMSPLWRAPYGEINAEIRRWAFDEGYLHIGWTNNFQKRESLDSLDWVKDPSSRLYRTALEIKQRLLNFGREANGLRGGIVLMHLGTDRESDRVDAKLGEIIDELTLKGYRFVKVSTLIDGDEKIKPYLASAKQLAMGEKQK